MNTKTNLPGHNYRANKKAARFRSTMESKTDQSQARETDRNVIVARFLQHGQAPGSKNQPMFGDFSNLPRDLRGMIEMGRNMQGLRKSLPEGLRDKPLEELLRLTQDDIKKILSPPAIPPAPPAPPAGTPEVKS